MGTSRWVVTMVLALAACGDDGVGKLPDAPGCPKLWDVTATGGTAAIAGGALVMSATSIPSGIAVQVVQKGFVGEFAAMISFTAWTAGGTGAYLQAVVSEDVATPASFFSAGIGTSPVVGISAAQQPGTADIKQVTATAGSFFFMRTGGMLTVTTTAGGMTATVTGTIGTNPARIGLQLGTSGGAVAATSASISELALAGGGGASQDAFDCDSLR